VDRRADEEEAVEGAEEAVVVDEDVEEIGAKETAVQNLLLSNPRLMLLSMNYIYLKLTVGIFVIVFLPGSYKHMSKFGILFTIVEHLRTLHQNGGDDALTLEQILGETNQLDVSAEISKVSIHISILFIHYTLFFLRVNIILLR